jgi:hypothetical protein
MWAGVCARGLDTGPDYFGISDVRQYDESLSVQVAVVGIAVISRQLGLGGWLGGLPGGSGRGGRRLCIYWK